MGAEPGDGGSSEIWAALRYGDVLGWQGEVERAAELWLHAAAVSHSGDLRSRCAAGEALFSAGDDERASTVLGRVVTECRATGSPGLLPYALHSLGLVETRRGRLTARSRRPPRQPSSHVRSANPGSC